MFSSCLCGSFQHHQEGDDDDEPMSIPRSPPRKSRKSSMFRSRNNKNPYANCGLDKFSALLADLEDRRQKIYTEMGSEDISFVRFMYSNSNDCRPVVVKVKNNKQDKPNAGNFKDKTVAHNNSEALEKQPLESSTITMMFSSCLCGSFQHHQEGDDDDEPMSIPRSPPRKSRKSSMFRSRNNKNPYANCGLDKFSALLADLEDRRQKIYTEMGSEDISFVRFMYSNSNDCRPVVVKVKNNKQDKPNAGNFKDKTVAHNNSEALEKQPLESSTITMVSDENRKKKKKTLITSDMKFDDWKWPYYLTAIIILILLFLAMFGRSFAILCTSIGWYLLPKIKERSTNLKRNKRDYIRRLSENKILDDGISSPRSVVNEN
ncbi:hypothetical protein F0562_035808 [Nyssa sinensis]|uniref:ZCF37 n=1 Tax=Nyssa sinensis TaxID=561372 RepID=A0A5J5ABZ7_9ASTE|nr:hypothetical protein F0562_035808 [Nyssa sinensis]